MANIVLRVTPEVLQSKADEFSAIAKNIKTYFGQIGSITEKTKGYWQGEAGTRDRESYGSFAEDVDFIVRRLEEHPKDLLTMAGIYKEAEQENVGTSAKLKTNRIV